MINSECEYKENSKYNKIKLIFFCLLCLYLYVYFCLYIFFIMYKLVNILEVLRLNNELDAISMFCNSKTPIKHYLMCIEFINEYRKQLCFDKYKFIYIDCIANNYHLKLLKDDDYDYLLTNVILNEKEAIYIYNTLLSENYVKELINKTWLEIVLGHNGEYNNSFKLDSIESVNMIIPLIMRCYNDINKTNLSILGSEYSQELKKFEYNENLISNKTLIIDFINYIENKSNCRVSVFIRCILFNYQNINNYDNLDNKTSNYNGLLLDQYSDNNDINNIIYTKSRFSLYSLILNYILSTLDLRKKGMFDNSLLETYNRNNIYLENGLLVLGVCNEGMGFSTLLVYDLNIKHFLMFNMYGSNDFDYIDNEKRLKNYILNSKTNKYIMLDNYISKYSNEFIINKVFVDKYEFCFDNNNDYKLAFNVK